MERIMRQERYAKHDSNYVTQLLDNFRSHPAILQFSNSRFYDSKLRAKGPKDVITAACDWDRLPRKNFPIIFHRITYPSMQMEDGFSFYNPGEIVAIECYVNLLLKEGINGRKIEQEDIGIISPYKAQIIRLKQNFQKFSEIEIGTTEYFQGREKNIIIISTVKSHARIGFLSNEKRLNVALTRAKFLMICVGNPFTLQKDKMWRKFVRYCQRHHAIVSELPKLKPNGIIITKI